MLADRRRAPRRSRTLSVAAVAVSVAGGVASLRMATSERRVGAQGVTSSRLVAVQRTGPKPAGLRAAASAARASQPRCSIACGPSAAVATDRHSRTPRPSNRRERPRERYAWIRATAVQVGGCRACFSSSTCFNICSKWPSRQVVMSRTIRNMQRGH